MSDSNREQKMENLNAEQVKRGLECCANNDECVGEACPYYTTGCEKNMPKDALSLIKELTEENERLNDTLKLYRKYNTAIKAERADTVRKMYEKNRRVFCRA